MKVKIQDKGNYMYVEPIGRVDTLTAPEFQKALDAAGENGAVRVVNFASVPYISSAGLRVVMIAAKANADGGSRLILCGLNDMVKEVFEISGFDQILNICADLAAAEEMRKTLAD